MFEYFEGSKSVTKCAFAMVYRLKCLFECVSRKGEIPKKGDRATAFTRLGVCRCDCEEGVLLI